jgi:hypothetical protein
MAWRSWLWGARVVVVEWRGAQEVAGLIKKGKGQRSGVGVPSAEITA